MWSVSYGGTTDPNGAFYLMSVWNASPPYFVLGKAGGGDAPKSGPITTNVWYHLAITYTNGTATLFLNGTNSFKASRTFNTALNGSFEIGRFEGQPAAGTFHGALDDVKIFNRALSASEIQQLFAIESQRAIPLTIQLGSVHLKFFGEAGVSYDIETTTDFEQWGNVRTVIGTGALIDSLEDTEGGTRFYRVFRR